MLGKIIKHEFISGSRRMGTVYLMAVIAAIAMIVTSFFKDDGWVKYLALMAVVLIAFAAVILTFVFIVFGMNKSLFGRQGYLTQTIPVRTSSLIFGKWFVSSVWVAVSYALVIVATIGVMAYSDSSGGDSMGIFNMVKDMVDSLGFTSKAFYTKLIFECIKGLINTWIFVLDVMFAMTIANIRPFDKLGLIGIILYLVVFIVVIQALFTGLNSVCDISLIIPYDGNMFFAINPDLRELYELYPTGYYTCQFTGLYFKMIVSVLVYILTVLLVERKINLK